MDTFKECMQRYIKDFEWYNEVKDIFMFVLFRDLNRTSEAPFFMRKITKNGINEIFKIYTEAKNHLDLSKEQYEKMKIEYENNNFIDYNDLINTIWKHKTNYADK